MKLVIEGTEEEILRLLKTLPSHKETLNPNHIQNPLDQQCAPPWPWNDRDTNLPCKSLEVICFAES